MLPRKSLIPLKKEFPRIRATGKTYDSPSFGLMVSYQPPTTNHQQPTSAFIVSKKIDKRSVVRHQIKRKLSDAVRPYLPRLAKNVELVFLAKKKAVEATREELIIELETILKRACLLG